MMYILAFVGMLLLVPFISIIAATLLVMASESWVDHEEDKYYRQDGK